MKRFSYVSSFLFIFLTASVASAADAARPAEKQWSLTTDFMGYFGGRFGVQLERALGPRDSLTVYGFGLFSSSSGNGELIALDDPYAYSTTTKGFGADFQWRHWFGPASRGLQGFFVAPGLELQHFDARTMTSCDENTYEYNEGGGVSCPASDAYSNHVTTGGISLDLGGQAIIGQGFVVGGSIGAHYRVAIAGDEDGGHPWTWELSNGLGFRPRFRVWMGWAF